MSDEPKRRDYSFDDITVVMGTYNEEEAIGAVLDDISSVTDGRADVICVDSSKDRTPEIAKDRGATVIDQPPWGYGIALHRGLTEADRPVIVTTDCDDTYPMDRLPDFLDLINEGYDVVSGDRLSENPTTMPLLNRAGNRLFAIIASILLGRRITDTTTGMRAYHRPVIESIEWTENTGLSAELLLRPIARGYSVIEVPIRYDERLGETTLDPFSGGVAIAKSILKVSVEERIRQLRG